MTPAIRFLTEHKIDFTVHTYQQNQESGNYGQDVADALNVEHDRLFKTLMISASAQPRDLSTVMIPVSQTLNLKLAASALKQKKVNLAEPAIAEKLTGYVVGGISPFGQKKQGLTIVDSRAFKFSSIYASAGKRGLQIEFSPRVLLTFLNAQSNILTTVVY